MYSAGLKQELFKASSYGMLKKIDIIWEKIENKTETNPIVYLGSADAKYVYWLINLFGANVNFSNEKGNTALHAATFDGGDLARNIYTNT